MSAPAAVGEGAGGAAPARVSARRRAARWLYGWMVQFADPIRLVRGVRNLGWYFRDWDAYRRLPGAEPLRWSEAHPQLHDRTATTGIDAHYFYVNGWAMRQIVAEAPAVHVDVGSLTIFANLLGAVRPVVFLDYRPLPTQLSGLDSVGASILQLPFRDGSVRSLSCLHVAEHIGLGRYGDPLDPEGTRKACRELARVLAPGGSLYFALPVGRERLCFNAHRVHDPERVAAMFPDLELVGFAGVDDDGRYNVAGRPSDFRDSEYACGMFKFVRRAAPSAGLPNGPRGDLLARS